MSQRSIAEIMAEGQKLTLEQLELQRKQITGELTVEESGRLRELNGYLLGLVNEAQAQGVGTAVGTGYGQTPVVENELADVNEEPVGLFDDDEDYWDEESPDGERYW